MKRTKIKICGLTNIDDARCAAEAGADMLGFIFYEPSPRYVSPETVAQIVRDIKHAFEPHPQCVGVFVNEPLSQVEAVVQACNLDLIQLHGEESPDSIDHFAGRAFKACNPKAIDEAQLAVETYLTNTVAPFIMMDAYHPQLRGGTGHTGDWQMAAEIAQDHALLLAGGLTPANAAEAIRTTNPWGVDVASGVEASKGVKDHAKVKAFVKASKEAFV